MLLHGNIEEAKICLSHYDQVTLNLPLLAQLERITDQISHDYINLHRTYA